MATPKKPAHLKQKVGAKIKLDDPEIREKFKAAARLDANIEASCAYAGITPRTYYSYIKEHPEFLQEVEMHQKEPYLMAINAVVKNLDDPEFALKYLERRSRHEFARSTEVTATVETTNKYAELTPEQIERLRAQMEKVKLKP